MVFRTYMDEFNRNNWVVLVVVMTAGILFTVNIFMFNAMLSGVADHVDRVVNNTSQNMTTLTSILIEEQAQGTNNTLAAIENFTDIMAQYSNTNGINLGNISNLLTDILRDQVLATSLDNNIKLQNLSDIVILDNITRSEILTTTQENKALLQNLSLIVDNVNLINNTSP